jgi:hypothetical protein
MGVGLGLARAGGQESQKQKTQSHGFVTHGNLLRSRAWPSRVTRGTTGRSYQ